MALRSTTTPPTAGRSVRVQRGVGQSLRQGIADGYCNAELDAGMMAMARTLAAQIDAYAHIGGDGWLVTRLAAELRETLVRLRLDPVSRGSTEGNIDEFLRALAEPSPAEVDDPAQP